MYSIISLLQRIALLLNLQHLYSQNISSIYSYIHNSQLWLNLSWNTAFHWLCLHYAWSPCTHNILCITIYAAIVQYFLHHLQIKRISKCCIVGMIIILYIHYVLCVHIYATLNSVLSTNSGQLQLWLTCKMVKPYNNSSTHTN